MLEVNHLTKQYEGSPLLCGITFTVAQDETICLLGPSGGGKSTILRIIAGLESADSGQIFWDGGDVMRIPPHLRQFGFMFQDYALFPHLNVRENVAFGLRAKHISEELVRVRVDEVLKVVGLQAFKDRSVIDLSGGEKQRIAFARAIAPRPRLLMLDEPMGALDRTLKDQLINELNELLSITDIPVIYVTHDQEEAFSIADRVLILHEGNIVQAGTPEDVYTHPGSSWIASFLGLNNQISGVVASIDPLLVKTKIGSFSVECKRHKYAVGESVDLVLISARFSINQAGGENTFPARVLDSRFSGDAYLNKIQINNFSKFSFYSKESIPKNSNQLITISPDAILCFKGSK